MGSKKKAAGLLMASVLTAGTMSALSAGPAQAAVACSVTYSLSNSWQGGYQAGITVRNTGDAWTSWRLAFSLPGGTAVSQGWGGTWTTGSAPTVTNAAYNGSVPNGGSFDLGFIGSGAAASPSGFSVNGVACSGGTGPTTGPTTPPPTTTRPPTSQPPTTRPPTTTTRPPTSPPPNTGTPGSCGTGSYNAEVVRSGSTWTSRNGSRTVYTGSDMLAAMRAGVSSLSAGRGSKERVVVRGDGTVPANQSLDLPNYTVLDVCGTITATGSIGSDNAVVRMRNVHDVEVPNIKIAGNVYFGIFVRNGVNIAIGNFESRLGSSGMGIRIDNHSDRSQWTRNVSINYVYASGGSSHGVETYGVDGIRIGTVIARNVGECGLLLNQTINATVGLVDAENAGTGTGYAAFRLANRAGRVGSSYATNIRVGTVKARGGGRGIFCVSESGGAVIDRIDIASTGGNAILLENCYGVTIAGTSGTVNGGGEVRIASRTEFAASRDITFQNLNVSNTNIRLSPCGTNNRIVNVTRTNSTLTWC